MPKLEVSMFEKTNSTPSLYTTAKPKDFVRTIPVSETKRKVCESIMNNVMGRIEGKIAAEKADKERARINAELAGKPFREFKEKLSNPRIKRGTKRKNPL